MAVEQKEEIMYEESMCIEKACCGSVREEGECKSPRNIIFHLRRQRMLQELTQNT